jgi:endoglucanase
MKMKNKLILRIAMVVFTCFLLAGSVSIFAEPRSGGAFYNYAEALQKAILFYKAQRAGDLPDNYVLPYRGDTCMNDGADVGLDLTGGWFDAGDHVKFGHPMAYTAAQLGWAVYEYRSAFETCGQLDIILDEIKWGLDFFMKCHPSPNVYYYDCGYGESDHSIWCPPEVVHMFTERTSFKIDATTPGSDVAGEASAALSLGAINFASTDPAYAAKCLGHAKDLFTFADTYRGKNPLNNFYQSGGYLDDLAWAAIWLYVATNDSTYLTKAAGYLNPDTLGGHWMHNWDDVSYGVALKLAQLTKDPIWASKIEISLDWWQPNGGLKYTPGGLAFLDYWGVLRYASTAAFLAFVWADDQTVGTASKKAAYHTFAEKQINYILGDNPKGGSYEVGFGTNPPIHPHHRTSHATWISMLDVPLFHRHILYGALVGGPDPTDKPNDIVQDYMLNEVADDYNAGFVGALARMYSQYGGTTLPNFPTKADLQPEEDKALTEYFTRGWISWEGPNDLDVLLQIDNRSAWPPTVRTGMYARYFMDLSEVFAGGFTTADVKIKINAADKGAILGPLTQWSGNVYYFDFSFVGTPIHPGGWDICEKEGVVRITSPVTGSNLNDWSYLKINKNPDYDCKTFTGIDENIPVYDNGVLLYGVEPAGGTGGTPAPTVVTTPEPTVAGTVVPTAIPTSTPQAGLTGDVNGSGAVDIVDALLVAQYYVGLSVPNFNASVADTNCSGSIDIVDALRIAQYYVGLLASLGC